ncbi:MAG: hypothetical protein ABSC13_06335 [Dehalococcoidia bacterium]|jgi:hypothetical protein
MTQIKRDTPMAQVDDQEVEQTAPLREFFCEPSGCGLYDTVGSEISEYVGGLRDSFCTGNKTEAAPMANYFDW